MSFFQQQPKSVKKAIRYILQDVHSLETLEQLEKMIRYYIQKRKRELLNKEERSLESVR
ncbi:LytR family transcriptional regulator [Geobacillus thermodenitrificans]|jgi:hypothetical protein|nr:LytR family transcriptional regulator [Geobacillus thermodenitrificans]